MPSNEALLQRRPRILVAHHEKLIGLLIAHILTHAGYDCRRASGRGHLRVLLKKRVRWDVLILHVGAMEEFKSLREWALRGRGKKLPVVLTAARPRNLVPSEYLNRARTFLQVPFKREQLLAILHESFIYKPM